MTTHSAAILAMSFNFITLIVLALWLFVPWARRRPLAAAITPLVIVHTGRTVALQLFSSQANGYDISDRVRDEIVWGDQLGFLLALLTLIAIWLWPRVAKPFAWAMVVVTVIDLANALVAGLRNDLLGKATDVSWMILTFYVPMLWISTGLIAWLLVTRRTERIAPQKGTS